MIHALVLGSGQRLFDHDDHVAKLQLLSATPITTGVILATYRPSKRDLVSTRLGP